MKNHHLRSMALLLCALGAMVFGYVFVENSHRQKVIEEILTNRAQVQNLIEIMSLQQAHLNEGNGKAGMLIDELGPAEKLAQDHELHPIILGLYLRSAAIHQHTDNIAEKVRRLHEVAVGHQISTTGISAEPAIQINVARKASAATLDHEGYFSTATLERLAREGQRIIDQLRNLTEITHVSASRTNRSMWLIERNVIELKRDMRSKIGVVSRSFEDANLPVNDLIGQAIQTIPIPYTLKNNQKTPLLSTQTTDLMLAEAFALKKQLAELHQSLPLSLPGENIKAGSSFGYRIDPFTKKRRLHKGLDFNGPRGAPILATGHGVVVEAMTRSGFGKVVVVAHGHGMKSLYAHLDKILVKKGQQVRLGDVIGKLGNTGRSTSPHLHYEILQDGKPFDPSSFIAAGKNLENILAKTGMLQERYAQK